MENQEKRFNWKKLGKYFSVTVLDIAAVAILTVISVKVVTANYVTNHYALMSLKVADLKYCEEKSKLVTEVANYINSVAPSSNLTAYSVVSMSEQYDIDLVFMLAQGEVESHFGTKGLARKTNSVWNVGAYDGLDSTQIAKVHKYKHPDDSIEPYCKLLSDRYLVDKTELQLMNHFTDKNGKRYASATTYESSLSKKYNYIKSTTQIDSLFLEMRHYKINSGN